MEPVKLSDAPNARESLDAADKTERAGAQDTPPPSEAPGASGKLIALKSNQDRKPPEQDAGQSQSQDGSQEHRKVPRNHSRRPAAAAGRARNSQRGARSGQGARENRGRPTHRIAPSRSNRWCR